MNDPVPQEGQRPRAAASWDATALNALIRELHDLRADLLRLEAESADQLQQLVPAYQASARNLLHYLALRRHDVRDLQQRLAAWGLSSLGRAEASVLGSVEALLRILHALAGTQREPCQHPAVPLDLAAGRALLERHTQNLLGPRAAQQGVRIMVTMPAEAATDYALVRKFLEAGMDCMRINCAHDGPAAWSAMIAHLRQAEVEVGRKCRVLMDLAGPKLRTGDLEPGPRVVKWRPRRDLFGKVVAPARIWLTPADQPEPPPGPASARVPLPRDWLARLQPGDGVRFRDTRNARRSLTVVEAVGASRWAEGNRTAYVAAGTLFQHVPHTTDRHVAPELREAGVGELPAQTVPLHLARGDTLLLTAADRPGKPAEYTAEGRLRSPAMISCTLPEVFADLRPGERVWLDDGKIGGTITAVSPAEVRIEITQARAGGAKLGADKGINLPDSELRLPALTEKDKEDLACVARQADLVGLSFVHSAADVAELREHLERVGGAHLGIVLKIETQRAFERLPHLLLAAMRCPCFGVMIARGDLAVECGFERLAELQEEILWVCEAAHTPVIWATQVLESLAKEGLPSRAEITDAAMGERAECVMLNKGPHILTAMHTLDNILRRMQAHQSKKRAMLRQLKLADQFAQPTPHDLAR